MNKYVRSKRMKERADGLYLLDRIIDNKNSSIIIHYSSNGLVEQSDKAPRITLIGIKDLQWGQLKCFSIDFQAQLECLNLKTLSESDIDNLEKKMLEDFFEFVKNHKLYFWLHWNMRDSIYGFETLSNRLRILGGVPLDIDIDRRFDCSVVIGKLYTWDYELDTTNGKLYNLANRNGISTKDFIRGDDEPSAFNDGKYKNLEASVFRKISVIESIIDLAIYKNLKVNTPKSKVYGTDIPGIIEIVNNNWILKVIYSIIIFVLGFIFNLLLQQIFTGSNHSKNFMP